MVWHLLHKIRMYVFLSTNDLNNKKRNSIASDRGHISVPLDTCVRFGRAQVIDMPIVFANNCITPVCRVHNLHVQVYNNSLIRKLIRFNNTTETRRNLPERARHVQGGSVCVPFSARCSARTTRLAFHRKCTIYNRTPCIIRLCCVHTFNVYSLHAFYSMTLYYETWATADTIKKEISNALCKDVQLIACIKSFLVRKSGPRPYEMTEKMCTPFV